MYAFTPEAEKEAGIRLKDCLTFSDAVSFFETAKTEEAKGHNCLLNAINVLYGIHTSCDARLAEKWLIKGAEEHADEDCRFALINLYLEAYGRKIIAASKNSQPKRLLVDDIPSNFSELEPLKPAEMEALVKKTLDSYYPLDTSINEKRDLTWQPFYFHAAFEETRQNGLYFSSRTKRWLDRAAGIVWLPNFVKNLIGWIDREKAPTVSEQMLNWYIQAAEKGSNLAKVELCRSLLQRKPSNFNKLNGWVVRNFHQETTSVSPMVILAFLLSLYHERNIQEAADVVIHFFLPVYYRHNNDFTDGNCHVVPGLGKVSLEMWRAMAEDIQTTLINLAEKGRADYQHIAGLFLFEHGQKQEALFYLKRAAAQGYIDANGLLFDILAADLRVFFAEYMQQEKIESVFVDRASWDKETTMVISAFWGKYDGLLYETLQAGARAMDGGSVTPTEYAQFLKEFENLGAHINMERVNCAKNEFYRLSNRLFSEGSSVRNI